MPSAPLPALTTPAYMLSVIGDCDEQECITDYVYIQRSGTWTFGDEAGLATDWLTSNKALFLGLTANNYTMRRLKVASITDITKIPVVTAVAAGSGTGGATNIPLEMAAIISKYTSTKGKHGRGRNYMPAVSSAWLTPGTDANRLNAAGNIAYNLLATNLLVPLVVGAKTFDMGIATRPTTNVNWTEGQACLTCYVQNLLGTCRRRRPGRGK